MFDFLSYTVTPKVKVNEEELSSLIKTFKTHLDKTFGSFENNPNCQIVLFDSASYPRKDCLGVYSRSERKIDLIYAENNFSKSNLLYEMTHNALHCLFGEVPRWLNEGLADYANFRSGKVIPGEVFPEMLKSIERASKEDKLLTLEDLTKDNSCFISKESANLAYCESWSLVHYLISSQKLPNLLERFKQGFNYFLTKEEIKSIEPKWLGYVDTLFQAYC